MRDLVSPMWRTTWGRTRDGRNPYERVHGPCVRVFTPHFLGTESWGLLVDSHGWITMWSTASRPTSSRRDRMGHLTALKDLRQKGFVIPGCPW